MIKKVALRTTDPKITYMLLKTLKKFGIPISEDGEIVIDDDLVKKFGINSLAGQIVCKIRGKEKFNELLIGIDVNSENKLTIVVLGDGEIIYSENATLSNIKDKVEYIINTFPHQRVHIGVGVGNRLGLITYKILKQSFPSTKMVNESKTSDRNPFVDIKDKDIRAAYLIALRSTL